MTMESRSAGLESIGTRSLSWRFTPHAPASASMATISVGGNGGRTKSPNGSRPRLPTVQSPKVNLSSWRGKKQLGSDSMKVYLPREVTTMERGSAPPASHSGGPTSPAPRACRTTAFDFLRHPEGGSTLIPLAQAAKPAKCGTGTGTGYTHKNEAVYVNVRHIVPYARLAASF